eukprot:6018298-Pyramimonas_sp.AAC.1
MAPEPGLGGCPFGKSGKGSGSEGMSLAEMGSALEQAGEAGRVEELRVRALKQTSFYGSSCANDGKDALNTPETLPLFSPPCP